MGAVEPRPRAPLSAVVITLNAAASLARCLESLSLADEIVVVDSGSGDDTVAIARAFGARVIHQPWLGFGPQKQFAVEQASHDWVLCLDADERVGDGLRAAIESALRGGGYQAYRMPRCNRFMGRWLRHGEGYPDWSLRLFDRRVARWSEDPVHEKVVTEAPCGALAGDLLHESGEDLSTYLDKQNRYTTLQAQALYRQGRRAGLRHLVASPLIRFVKFYFIRRGFLDGMPGFVHIAIGCFNSFVKYAKLAALHLERTDE